ncbi:unnamed protein product [Amoebophrya sp. A120]|nr:unnamed protein product [Amoebophrya sp. A120]|eukprot:GSA120T00000772001.1
MRDGEGLTNGSINPGKTAFDNVHDATMGHFRGRLYPYSCWWKDASSFPVRIQEGCYYAFTAALTGAWQNPRRADRDCCEEVPGEKKCRRVENAPLSCPKYEATPGHPLQTAWFR